jgi:hypothetical protein
MARVWFAAVTLGCFVAAVSPPHQLLAAGLADRVVESARADCRSLDNGSLKVGNQAVSAVDLTGDGRPEQLVDARGFTCSTSATLFCGTGGCAITIISGDTTTEFLAKAWKVVHWDDRPVLLLAVHGSECGGSNLRRCYRAVVWSEEGFRSRAGN